MQNLIEVCQDCGSRNLKFGSRDPCEGDYYWCDDCGNGPILFPLNYRRKFVAPVLDAGKCCSCEAVRICMAIVPDGKWNPYGGQGVKPCPGVLE